MFREPRKSLPQVFIDERVEAKKSSIHGWGCFAKEDIEPNILIESAPIILCHKDVMDALYDMNSSRHILQDYPFSWKDGMLAYAMGWAAVYNHQNDNNCRWRPNYDYETLEFTTKKKIKAGEEITVRYLPYRLRGGLWFVDEQDEDVDMRTFADTINSSENIW